jgi:arginine/lysine/ornithine decarboxylase
LHFSELLPNSGIEAGADIETVSMHKQGGALQGTSVILWNKTSNISWDDITKSYKSYTSTSPSFILHASIETAREYLESEGEERIEELTQYSSLFKKELRKIKQIVIFDRDKIRDMEREYEIDPTKILVNIEGTNMCGHNICTLLEEKHDIVIEKATEKNLLFLIPFQCKKENIFKTVDALRSIIADNSVCCKEKDIDVDDFPRDNLKKYSPTELKDKEEVLVDLDESIGKVSAENIVIYPPGISVVSKGEIISKSVIHYLNRMKNCLQEVQSFDRTLNKVAVVKE